MAELDINKLDARYQELKSERTGWDAAWSDLAELFLPTKWRSDTDSSSFRRPMLNPRLVNTTGVLAMRTLAAGLHGGMTSPVRPWFRLQLAVGDDDASPGVHAWLDEVTERMQIVLHDSNFYDCVHTLYADLCTFGTALMFEEADEDGLHFSIVRAGEYVLDVDNKGQVDTFYRRLHMTARQIVQQWGEDHVPDAVRTAARNANLGGAAPRFNVVHAVFPRRDVQAGAHGTAGMPYRSVYWLREGSTGGHRKAILSDGGYRMFPAFAPRWDVSGTDVYGRSPAMDVVPDVKMLQAMTTTLRIMQHKIADPPMLGDSSLRRYGVDRNPGGFTFGDFQITQGKPLVAPIQQPDAQALGHTMEAIRDVENTVRAGLYVDLFRMMTDDDRRQITATEIQARQAEKMLLIGPVVERLHAELLSPLIKRTYALMGEWGALPDPPEGVGGAELDVRFESVLAQAQRLTSTSAIDQGLTFIANMAGVVPNVIDVIDSDATARAYLERVGVPEACIADEQDVEEARAARAQAQQAQEQMAQAQQMAAAATDATAAAKNLGQTPVGADGQTLMGTLLGGLGGGGVSG